ISNLIGQTVYRQKVTSINTNINISDFDSGVYLVIMRNTKNQRIEKLIIK
ncbi:MAG: hypothetical protein C0599_12830, partial [Salinivirgaceae bacterium]